MIAALAVHLVAHFVIVIGSRVEGRIVFTNQIQGIIFECEMS